MAHKNTLDDIHQTDPSGSQMMEFAEPCVSIVTVDEWRLSSGSQAHVKIPSTALSDLTHPLCNKIIPYG